MSVKLGNTSIAGTQVLYSTTGNNTDGAMTQSATTSALSTKSNDIDVVHKTGDETIGGVKTFNSAINLANGTWNAVGDDAYIGDRNLTGCVCIKGNNGHTGIRLFNRDETVNLGFYIDENDGNALKLTNPTYSANHWGSVTAMVGQNLSGDGYVKYNNGLIIQWGYKVASASGSTITFPTPFLTTNYKIVGSFLANVGRGDQVLPEFYNYTTTGCSFKSQQSFAWIAIGY